MSLKLRKARTRSLAKRFDENTGGKLVKLKEICCVFRKKKRKRR